MNNKKISFFLVGFFLSGLSFFLTEEALGKFCPTAQIECTSYTTGKKTTYPVLKIGEDCTPLKKGSFSIEEGVVNCEKSGGSPRFLEAPSDKEYNFSGKASVPQKNTVGEVNTVITAVSGIVGLKNISEKNKKSLKPYEISGKKAKLQKKIGDMNKAYLKKVNEKLNEEKSKLELKSESELENKVTLLGEQISHIDNKENNKKKDQKLLDEKKDQKQLLENLENQKKTKLAADLKKLEDDLLKIKFQKESILEKLEKKQKLDINDIRFIKENKMVEERLLQELEELDHISMINNFINDSSSLLKDGQIESMSYAVNKLEKIVSQHKELEKLRSNLKQEGFISEFKNNLIETLPDFFQEKLKEIQEQKIKKLETNFLNNLKELAVIAKRDMPNLLIQNAVRYY